MLDQNELVTLSNFLNASVNLSVEVQAIAEKLKASISSIVEAPVVEEAPALVEPVPVTE